MGTNAHRHHVCVAVAAGAKGYNPKPWTLALKMVPAKAAKPVTKPKDPMLSLGTSGPYVERMQKLLQTAGIKLKHVNGDFGLVFKRPSNPSESDRS